LTNNYTKKKANPEKFKTIPGLEIEANPDPENPGIPGFLQNPVPKIPGLKLLIPLGPGRKQRLWKIFSSEGNFLTVNAKSTHKRSSSTPV
jgi:hypothetical protein